MSSKTGIAPERTEFKMSNHKGHTLSKVRLSDVEQRTMTQAVQMIRNIEGADKAEVEEWYQINGCSAHLILIKLRDNAGYKAVIFSNKGNMKRVQDHSLPCKTRIGVEGNFIVMGKEKVKVAPSDEVAGEQMLAAA